MFEYIQELLFQDVALSLNIPTIVELTNIYPYKHLVPTVFVAPSHYAAQHESVEQILYSSLTSSSAASISSHGDPAAPITTKPPPKVVVISPSVDVSKFNNEFTRKYMRHNVFYPHKSCAFSQARKHINSDTSTHKTDTKSRDLKQQENAEQPPRQQSKSSSSQVSDNDCVHIGYVGRLDADKNPGLFLQFAYILLYDYYPLARFTIIGMYLSYPFLSFPIMSCTNC